MAIGNARKNTAAPRLGWPAAKSHFPLGGGCAYNKGKLGLGDGNMKNTLCTLLALQLLTVPLISGVWTPIAQAQQAPVSVVLPPFQAQMGDGEAWWGMAFAEAIRAGLTGTQVLSPGEASRQLTAASGNASTRPEPSLEIARMIGSSTLISGNYQAMGSLVIVSVQPIDVATGRSRSDLAFQLEGNKDNLQQLWRDLAQQAPRLLGAAAHNQPPEGAYNHPEAFGLLAQGAMAAEQGRWNGAIPLLERAVALRPELTSARLKLAEGLLAQALASPSISRPPLLQQALTHTAEILKRQPEEPFALRLQAQALNLSGQTEAARQALERALPRYPRDEELVKAWLDTARPAGLIAASNGLRSLGVQVDHPPLQALLGSRFLAAGASQDTLPALQMLISAAHKLPTRADLPLQLTTWYLSQGQVLEAKTWLKEAQRLAPDDSQTLWANAELQLQAGNTAAAYTAVQQVLARNPAHAEAWLTLARIERRRQQPSAALEALQRAGQLRPDDLAIQRENALLRRDLKQEDEALQLLEKTLRQAESQGANALAQQLYQDLASVYRQRRAYPEALRYYQRMSTLVDLSSFYREWSQQLATAERYTEALELFKKYLESDQSASENPENQTLYRRLFLAQALQQRPNDPRILNDLGQMALAEKDYDQARKYLTQALSLDKNNSVIHFNLGVLYLATGDPKQAVSSLSVAVAMDANYVNAWYNLGLAYSRLKNKDKASLALRQALRRDPNHEGVKAALRQLGETPK
jgi:tetratricopeptide (TPR) repeat protein